MRLTISTPLIVLLLIAPLLAGCLERGQQTMVSGGDDDDATANAAAHRERSPGDAGDE